MVKTAIPCMRESAEGRSVTLVLDSAPYHTRALNQVGPGSTLHAKTRHAYFQVPQRSSAKEEIRTFLSEQGVDVAADSTKSDLLDEVCERYSYGKTAGKGKWRRAVVVAAMSEEGVVPGNVRVVVTGRRSQEEDYHKDMDARMFEEWLRTAILCMRESAEGRSVTLVLDIAPYNTRALNQVPQRSSSKEEIRTFLSEQGVDVAADSTKLDLSDELDAFVASRGGRAVLRQPASESICHEMGIRLLRLPPLHCFFNPIELCWHFLKHSLNKVGKPSDKIELVRRKTLELLDGVTRNQCEGWLRETIREERMAREKELSDRERNEAEFSQDVETGFFTTEYDSDFSEFC